MEWLEVSVTAPQEFVEPLSQIFYRYGHGGVAVERPGGFNPDEGESPPESAQVTLKTYLPINSSTAERRTRIDIGVRLVAAVCPVSPLAERVIQDQDWEKGWKDHFHPLRVGRRIVVCPSWRTHDARPSDVVVTLDPGMAFGTGDHPTTGACLRQLEDLVHPGMDVLDVGCGSGILSIAAAKLGARSVLGLDVDGVAVAAASANVRDNGVAHMVYISHGGLPHPRVGPGAYHLVLANISSRVIAGMADDLARALKPGGKLVASGIVTANANDVVQRLVDVGVAIDSTLTDGEWVTLVASAPGCNSRGT